MAAYRFLTTLLITQLFISTPIQSFPVLETDTHPKSLLFKIYTNLFFYYNQNFNQFSKAALKLYETSGKLDLAFYTAWTTPITIFSLKDSSNKDCPSCTTLFQEHTLHGLFTFEDLKNLTSTKFETIIPYRCLTITTDGSNVFVRGIRISKPDMYSNSRFVIHGLDGVTSQELRPLESCTAASNNVVVPSRVYDFLRLWLSESMGYSVMSVITGKLQGNPKYSVLASAMHRIRYGFESLNNMTVFALDDVAVYEGEPGYERDIKFHIVPNRLLKMDDLMRLPVLTSLPTLAGMEKLTVTTAANGVEKSFRINYVRIKAADMYCDGKIVVHGIVMPFPRLVTTPMEESTAITVRNR